MTSQQPKTEVLLASSRHIARRPARRRRRPRRRCRGASGRGHARRRHEAHARRVLDAARGVRAADPAVPEDGRGQGRQLRPVVRQPPASRAARSAPGSTADVVALSLEPDVTELVAKGLVDKNWNKGFYKGMVTNSVVVFAVRDGNPKKIRNWDDLIKPGVEVITPNPITSGGARWNVMAAYGAQRKLGKTRQAGAATTCAKLFQHVDRAGQERPRVAADVPRRQGRRAARVRERGGLREQEGPEGPVRDPALDDPDREPGRGGQEDGAPEGGERVRQLPAHARGAEDLRRERLPARRQERRASSSRTRHGRALFTINQLGIGGWAKGAEAVLRPARTGSSRRSRSKVGAWLASRRQRARRPQRAGYPRWRRRSRRRHRLSVPDRPAFPSPRSPRRSFEDGLAGVLGRDQRPAGGRGAAS